MLETVGVFSLLFFFLFAVALVGLPLVDGYISYLFGGKLKNYMVAHFRFRSQYWLGGLGVIIHELGHAFFALLFRHQITSATFLNFHPDNGTLGSVQTAWNPRSIYQRLGNFFIGIAPLFSGLFVFWLLITVLLHPVLTAVPDVSGRLSLMKLTGLVIRITESWLLEIGQAFFNADLWQQIIPIVLIGMISTTVVGLSKADLSCSWVGVPVLLTLIAILSVFCAFVALNSPAFIAGIAKIIVIVSALWLVLLMFILVCLTISFVELLAASLLFPCDKSYLTKKS